jgi:hypothetical protein
MTPIERCAVCGGDLDDHWLGSCPDVTVTMTAEVALALVKLAGVAPGGPEDLVADTRRAIVEIAENDLGREIPNWHGGDPDDPCPAG